MKLLSLIRKLWRKGPNRASRTVPTTLGPETTLPELTAAERAHLYAFIDNHNATMPYVKPGGKK